MHQASIAAHTSLNPKQDRSFSSRLLLSFSLKDDSYFKSPYLAFIWQSPSHIIIIYLTLFFF